MKCYYTIDPKTLKKVLIPMCYSVANTLDKQDCTCPYPLTAYRFEKERFIKALQQKNETISSMQAEIKHLNEIIKTLKNERNKE
jgi:uncharacterized protein YfcZ (UPF0381/DUF406 family)